MKTNQFSWLFTIVFTLIIMFHLLLYFFFHKQSFTSMMIILVVVIIVFLLFYKMTIEVDEQKITISFGIGLIKRQVALNSIATVDTVSNSVIQGWGIRYGHDYVLYNVGGTKAIEITFKDGGRKIRIGSKNPEILLNYIKALIR
jgi:hypothetical protein